MWPWRKSKPKKPETFGHELNAAFQHGDRSWTERVDLLDILAEVMSAKGHQFNRQEHSLVDTNMGYVISPELLSIDPGENGVQTCTITSIFHPDLIPNSIFEYQHSAGENMAVAFHSGFKSWEETDYEVLQDAVKGEPENGMHMLMKYPSGRQRRILFGPVSHFVENRQVHQAARQCSTDDDDHPFCPCCLFTRSIDAFQPALESDDFQAIRMFALRNSEGGAESDCRINGHDNKQGMKGLRKYVETWPDAGCEFRKQYVLIFNAFP